MFKKYIVQFVVLCMSLCLCCFCANAEGEPEMLLEDNFESYGVDGSGLDENGKAINPVFESDNGNCWFNQEASSKRGTLIRGEETGNHYLSLWKQTKPAVILTNISKAIKQETTEAINKQYTFSMRVNFPKSSEGSLAAAGCIYEMAVSKAADHTSDLPLVSIIANKNSAALSVGGLDTGKTLSPETWYELKTVVTLIGEKAYLSTYCNSENCAESQEIKDSAAAIKEFMQYFTIKADFNGILDSRSKETIKIDDISLIVEEAAAPPLIASFSPQNGSAVTDSSAPLSVDFDSEIEDVTAQQIIISNGGRIASVEMNETGTGFYVKFEGLKEGTLYHVNFSAVRPGEERQDFTYTFIYTGNRERYVCDWFDSYGVNGSGLDESGKGINPVSASESYGKWYNKEAAAKRGAIIQQDENKVPALNFYLQSQNKVIRTQMSSLLRRDAAALGMPQGVYELNTGFIIPYGTDAVGLRGDCYAKVSLGSENMVNDLFCIDYADGKNRIRFLGNEKTSDLSENRAYSIKMIIYPEERVYTADAFITDERNGTVQILNREPVQINQLEQMKKLLIDVNGYDSQKSTKLFTLKGIEFQCCFTPKLLTCDAAGKTLSIENNVVTAEFDTQVPEQINCYSIDNGARIVRAERLEENKIRLTIEGLKNSEQYELRFDGVKNIDGYSCLDRVIFGVENKIEVTDIALENRKLSAGENTFTAKLKNTTDQQLTASVVLCVCVESGEEYRIEQVLIEKKENVLKDDKITVPFSLESSENRFIKVFLIDNITDMRPIYDEVQYR